jgi:hypothetical protein
MARFGSQTSKFSLNRNFLTVNGLWLKTDYYRWSMGTAAFASADRGKGMPN